MYGVIPALIVFVASDVMQSRRESRSPAGEPGSSCTARRPVSRTCPIDHASSERIGSLNRTGSEEARS